MLKKIILGLLIIALLILVFSYKNLRNADINTLKINSLKNINKTILQISDFHSSNLINLKDLEKRLKDKKIDFAVLTGDIYENDLKQVQDLFNMLKNLGLKTYIVLGNHEEAKNLTILEDYFSLIKSYGFKLLRNEKITLDDIDIYGVDFFSFENPKVENSNKFNLLLMHAPHYVKYLNDKYDLILSGHTHGGQVRLPFIGALFVPGQSKIIYDKGLYDTKWGKMNVDSGVGYTGLPLRLFNKAQVSLIEIN